MEWELKRVTQCQKCPWKTEANPHAIPGYNPKDHKELKRTIAEDTLLDLSALHVMSCHEHETEEQIHCVGWLHNQLGVGNNISLRMRMRGCKNVSQIRVMGQQHQYFEDTLPDG